jgi:fumarate hydratase class II
MGSVEVSQERLWGAQTQRSLEHFRISTERMPPELIAALVELKRAAAQVNARLALLAVDKAAAIVAACDEVLSGGHPDEFPLVVWQTGSGTQTNMNVNEVLANRASELLGGARGMGRRVHPNDEVNLGQSSNDVFPSAMHVAAARGLHASLLPALAGLREALQEKVVAFAELLKVGRTHLQDATPLTLGQEFSGYVSQLDQARAAIEASAPGLQALAIGGTAVGTGLNTHPQFAELVARELSARLGLPFKVAPNAFAALAGHEAMLFAHGALRTLAASLTKLANDLRWMGSGPRSGLGELRLPENEPGSSIMPGKVNPTQCEALLMLCCQVFGNDVTVGLAGASGNFELNAFKPVLAQAFLQSVRLLADGMASFTAHCVKGLEPNRGRLEAMMQGSLMLVTALAPHLGYDRASHIALAAHQQGTSLRAAALADGVTGAQFDEWVQPLKMAHPRRG